MGKRKGLQSEQFGKKEQLFVEEGKK